jgi:hypothetical protein
VSAPLISLGFDSPCFLPGFQDPALDRNPRLWTTVSHADLARWPELQAMTDFFAEPAPEDLDEDEDDDDLDSRADYDYSP